ncbi:MAG: dimethylsulfonioproprionate lyase family protein [Acidobacteria bacterium]|nr:dimethylsulfonioproprionate lyase family protein [Acidobacteriota bacterium]
MRKREPVITDQADVDWEDWADPANSSASAIRWKLLISRERSPSGGLVTGVAKIEPGAALSRHHHEPEETYYVLSGRGRIEIENTRQEIGPGTAIYIPPNARHALRCTGAEPLVFIFTFPRDRFEDIVYHLDG